MKSAITAASALTAGAWAVRPEAAETATAETSSPAASRNRQGAHGRMFVVVISRLFRDFTPQPGSPPNSCPSVTGTPGALQSTTYEPWAVAQNSQAVSEGTFNTGVSAGARCRIWLCRPQPLPP